MKEKQQVELMEKIQDKCGDDIHKMAMAYVSMAALPKNIQERYVYLQVFVQTAIFELMLEGKIEIVENKKSKLIITKNGE